MWFEILRRYRRFYKNYYSVLLSILLKKRALMVMPNNTRFFSEDSIMKRFVVSRNLAISMTHIEKMESKIRNIRINNKESKFAFEFLGKNLTFIDGIFNGDIEGVFFNESYSQLNVKNKCVIDVGASIGDSALYFLAKGAYAVFAFEAYPFTYSKLLENIQDNGADDKVKCYNLACGKDEELILDADYKSDGSDAVKQFKQGQNVKSLSLNNVISKVEDGGTSPFSMKIDCEGCEYELILNAQDKIFDDIQEFFIEYHYGYEDIKKKLESNSYTVSYSEPTNDNNPKHPKKGKLGTIYARKEAV